MNTGASNLRKALQDPNAFITAPGVYDGLSARIALNVGFDALYMVCPLDPTYKIKYPAKIEDEIDRRRYSRLRARPSRPRNLHAQRHAG
jgi:hypothetical protein